MPIERLLLGNVNTKENAINAIRRLAGRLNVRFARTVGADLVESEPVTSTYPMPSALAEGVRITSLRVSMLEP